MAQIELFTLGDSAAVAAGAMGIFGGEALPLVKLGLEPIDEHIGGLGPSSGGLLLMDQGVGKSSTILTSAYQSPDMVGIVSTEDGADVLGARALAMISGVNSLKMRLGRCSDEELARVREAQDYLDTYDGVMVAYAVGGSLEDVLRSTDELGKAGCRLIWLDYVQKVRGHRGDRNNEVAEVYTRFQGRCAAHGAASMVASQVTMGTERDGSPRTGMPRANNARETRDLANEARLIICGCVNQSVPGRIDYLVDKSTVGGAGLKFSMQRDESGSLRLCRY